MVKAILLDAGGVLVRPATGNWFVGPNFFRYVDRRAFEAVPAGRRRQAFGRGLAYIDQHGAIPTVDVELVHFTRFYEIVFEHLPGLAVDDEQIAAAAEDLVFNPDKYLLFDEVRGVLARLREEYLLAVVSDAWPSLELVFEAAGLRDAFSAFVVSSVVDARKPAPTIYQAALDTLGIHAEEAFFVDDHVWNCAGARRLGMRSALLCRSLPAWLYQKAARRRLPVRRSLTGIERVIAAAGRG